MNIVVSEYVFHLVCVFTGGVFSLCMSEFIYNVHVRVYLQCGCQSLFTMCMSEFVYNVHIGVIVSMHCDKVMVM